MTAAAPIRLALVDPAAVEALQRFAGHAGWRPVGRREPSPTHAGLESWQVPETGTTVHRVDDRFLGVNYLELEGPAAAALVTQLDTSIATLDLDDVAAALRSPRTPDNRRAALLRYLGVLAPRAHDDTLMHLIADGLQCASPEPRAAALEVIAALGWPELRPLLVAVALADESDALRARATRIARAFDAVGS